MKNLFSHKLYSQRLFCRRCQVVTDHSIMAREGYSTLGGMDSHIPLLCCCDTCQTLFISFSHEFYFCRLDQVNHEYTKVFGVNRISPGNWLYFKGSQKPGIVKSVFQGPLKDVVNISYDGGPDQKVECAKIVIKNEEAPGGYRLLPAQSAYTLMGDPVYHSIRNQFGVAVGLVRDGDKDKLAVLLKDNTLVFISLPAISQNLPNEKLSELVRNKLAQVFPEDANRVTVEAGQGVVYLQGTVKNLSVKRTLVACINGLPKVRGCVDISRVQEHDFVTDVQIEKMVLSLIESPSSRLFDYRVQVVNGRVDVYASCNEKYYSRDFENKIMEMPGVQDLNCFVNRLPEESLENELVCRQIETDLALNSLLQRCCIKVSCSNKKFLLEGFVRTAIQKQIAYLSTMKKARTTGVENRLRQV
ncbi:MAG: BON domain-containing protein [Fibrobacter sp.]|nr:BON domain-containing protein [Fibrobacter sp.]